MGHNPTRGSDQEAFKNTAGRLGSDHEVCDMSRVGLGPITSFLSMTRRARSPRPDPTREKGFDP